MVANWAYEVTLGAFRLTRRDKKRFSIENSREAQAVRFDCSH